MKIFFLTDHFERYEQCGLSFVFVILVFEQSIGRPPLFQI